MPNELHSKFKKLSPINSAIRLIFWDIKHTLRGLIKDKMMRRIVLITALLAALFLTFIFGVAIYYNAHEKQIFSQVGQGAGMSAIVCYFCGILSLRFLGDALNANDQRFERLALSPQPASLSILLGLSGMSLLAMVPLLVIFPPLFVVLIFADPNSALSLMALCTSILLITYNVVFGFVNTLLYFTDHKRAGRIIQFVYPLMGLGGAILFSVFDIQTKTLQIAVPVLIGLSALLILLLLGQMTFLRKQLLCRDATTEKSSVSYQHFPWWKFGIREGGPQVLAGSTLLTLILLFLSSDDQRLSTIILGSYLLNIPVFSLLGRILKEDIATPDRLALAPCTSACLKQLHQRILIPFLGVHLLLLIIAAALWQQWLWAFLIAGVLLVQVGLNTPQRFAKYARPLSFFNLLFALAVSFWCVS